MDFKDIFFYELIQKNLLSFLRCPDLKNLTQVCQDLSDKTTRSLRFKEIFVLKINEQTFVESNSLKDLFYIPKCVNLDISLSLKNLKILIDSGTLNKVHFIKLSLSRIETIIEDDHAINFLYSFLNANSLDKLPELEIQSEILDWTDLHAVFMNKKIQSKLSKIKKLCIFSRASNIWISSRSHFTDNLSYITTIVSNLKSFKINKIKSSQEVKENCYKLILDIISSSEDTLEELNIPAAVWNLDVIQTMRFPNLNLSNKPITQDAINV